MVKKTSFFKAMSSFYRVIRTLVLIIVLSCLLFWLYDGLLCVSKTHENSGRLLSKMSKCVFNAESRINRTTGQVKCPLFPPNLCFWTGIKVHRKPHYQAINALNRNTIQNPTFIEKKGKVTLNSNLFRVLPGEAVPWSSAMALFHNFFSKKTGVRSWHVSEN